MAGQHGSRRGRLGGGLAGEREQGLAGDPQMTGRLVELAEPGGQVLHLGAGLLGLAGQSLLACLDLVQQHSARVLSGHQGTILVRCHVPRQAGVQVYSLQLEYLHRGLDVRTRWLRLSSPDHVLSCPRLCR